MTETAAYREGRRDGLRQALDILATLEAKLATRLDAGKLRQTRIEQRVRHKAIQVAQTRIQTALNARERADATKGDQPEPHLPTALKRLGFITE